MKITKIETFTAMDNIITISKVTTEAGIDDRSYVAGLALKWVLQDENVASVMIGVANASQLIDNVDTLKDLNFSKEDQIAMNQLFGTDVFKKEFKQRKDKFYAEQL